MTAKTTPTHIASAGAAPTDPAAAIADRWAVHEACTKMAWLADQRDWDALVTLFCDRVTWDYTSLNGGDPVELASEDVVTAWAAALGPLTATQHLVGNHLVTIAGDDATCTATFEATHVYPNPHGDPLWTLGGDYRYGLRRIDGAWRIAAVTMTAKWATGNQHIMTLATQDGAS